MEWGDKNMSDKKVEITIIPEREGRYIYADLVLPATDSEIEDAMQRARITEEYDGYIDIVISECPALPRLEHRRLESPTVKELNLLATRLEKLSEWELTAAGAIYNDMIEKNEESDNLIPMKDIINMTYGLDSVPVMNGIGYDGQLGEYIIDNGVEEYIKELSDEALSCLDAEQVGKKYREKENGKYMDGFYVGVGHYKNPEIYDGEHLPPEENPELGEGVFRLLVAKAPEENPEEVIDNAKWLALPVDKAKADELAKSLGEKQIEDCVYFDIRTGIPKVDELVFTDMGQFDKLNELSKKYLEFSEAHKMCFKALLERESPQTLNDVLEIANIENQYNFINCVADEREFAKMYLKYHLPAGFDYKFIDELEVAGFSNKLLDRLGASVTEYGVVSDRNRGLFEIIPYDAPVHKIRQENGQMGGMEM